MTARGYEFYLRVFATLTREISSRTPEDIEHITCPLVDMNFIFSCSTRYLTSERIFRRFPRRHR